MTSRKKDVDSIVQKSQKRKQAQSRTRAKATVPRSQTNEPFEQDAKRRSRPTHGNWPSAADEKVGIIVLKSYTEASPVRRELTRCCGRVEFVILSKDHVPLGMVTEVMVSSLAMSAYKAKGGGT